MNEHLQLADLAKYLKPSGQTKLTKTSSGQLGLSAYTLTHVTDGQVPFTWPVSGVVDFSLTWDENTMAWSCSGNMYGTNPSGNNPKVWLHQVSKSLKNQEQILKGLLQKCATLWERYRGDLEQFSYRLGVEMSSTAHVQRYEQGYSWTHTAHPEIRMFFSPDPVKPGYGMLPQSRFGWYEPVGTHQWFISIEGLTQMRDGLAKFSHEARSYCEGASACFGQNDSALAVRV
jgi:hypothetical protein